MSKTSNNGHMGIEHEEGSGNVFADLGLPDADERLARSKLGFHVYKLLADRELTQREIAALLGIRAAGGIPPDERAFQPLHHRQAARLPQAPRSQGDDPDQPAPPRRTLSGSRLRPVNVLCVNPNWLRDPFHG